MSTMLEMYCVYDHIICEISLNCTEALTSPSPSSSLVFAQVACTYPSSCGSSIGGGGGNLPPSSLFLLLYKQNRY